MIFLFIFCMGFAPKTFAEEAAEVQEEKSSLFWDVITWPFSHIVQPVINAVVFPIAAPLHYAFTNGIVERGVDLFTFGKNDNIMLYPVFNFKPGTNTLVGATYRHRSLFFNKDYLVLEPQFYANSDWYFSIRYSKQELFGLPLFGDVRFTYDLNRDASFVLPLTKKSYAQPDSSFNVTGRFGFPLSPSQKWNLSFSASLKYVDASLPETEEDTVYRGREFPVEARGLYQEHFEVPLNATLVFDNLDYAYAPSKGNRFILNTTYAFVGDYRNGELDEFFDDKKNHDYVKTEIVYQHYFYLGSSGKYILSKQEAREARRFYTDFSWDEVLRIWHPNHMRETLFERRVLALQLRMNNLWEIEEGEAPFNAYTRLNARYPLRGYGDSWAASHIVGLSAEYRWPIDRFIDGVLFDEYALIAEEFGDWSFDKFYNSWGIGIRVRQPNLYLFRVQLGFHGLHGINLIMTIAPEFR